MTQFTIPMTAWTDFTVKLAKLNRKAKKIGCEAVTYEVLSEGDVERRHTFKVDGEEITKLYRTKARTIELTGAAPRIEGWQFIARIEYLSDAKSVLFHQVPGCEVKIDDRFRSLRPSTCEHCNKVRMRRDTFVVRNVETGIQTQVGRQCLADFTGINRPEDIAARASWLSTFSNMSEECERMWRGYFADVIDTHHALALTSAYISRLGWTPRSAQMAGATANLVGRHFWAQPKDGPSVSQMREIAALAESAEHQDRAARVIEWIKRDLAKTARSDYEMNLVTLVANDLTESKHLGIVCSAVAAYQRAMNQKVEYAKRQEAHKDSTHVGEVGKRMRDLDVKIEFLRVLEGGAFGPRTLVKFSDDAGNVMTWFASADRDYIVGARVKIDGTVKKHDEYQGIKQTVLSRVTIHETAAA